MRTTALLFLCLFVIVPAVASAQDCTISPYADPAGTRSLMSYCSGDFPLSENGAIEFSIYVDAFSEGAVESATYRLVLPDLGTTLFVLGRSAGPGGSGEFVDEPVGTWVQLGECVSGASGVPIQVARIDLQAIPDLWYGGVCLVERNMVEDAADPQVYDCEGVQRSCPSGPPLYLDPTVVPTTARSMAQIKSLYR